MKALRDTISAVSVADGDFAGVSILRGSQTGLVAATRASNSQGPTTSSRCFSSYDGGLQVTTDERTEAEYKRLWTTNVKGTFLISKRLAPIMNKGARLGPLLTLGHCQDLLHPKPEGHVMITVRYQCEAQCELMLADLVGAPITRHQQRNRRNSYQVEAECSLSSCLYLGIEPGVTQAHSLSIKSPFCSPNKAR